MALSNSKRNLIFGRISALLPVRPPWALSENDFTDRCTRCGDCIEQCPLKIIRRADGGFPELDFSLSGCDFCQACVTSCKVGALTSDRRPAIPATALINDQCLSVRGVICRSCAESCDQQAIQFQLVVGGSADVLMNNKTCNGCGECVHGCPVSAITIRHKH